MHLTVSSSFSPDLRLKAREEPKENVAKERRGKEELSIPKGTAGRALPAYADPSKPPETVQTKNKTKKEEKKEEEREDEMDREGKKIIIFAA